ncbi:uncharacterized protein LOC125661521 [Ostrea edulis]|uniref:uncharacterized protein LOC125661521 n=1 Tax=Ostrea edulis TaxID=37623 RepID=UPI0024AEFD6A|nr:uncharacterized protein LOC125661521 [Ostrea edulis]XP_048749510.2 uncharacterized protein LOC125661521 [Ostrea edulis]XP_048749511.2 uncharacterized protein LOC125661521 [Ostrea edulis]XP_048749512.2 uncharacterized protein LOC125661521 [Ostrea edulis]XP_048749514.2 uncharacterized protein LOC125661521 [Ostrea edulis]XP_056002639.1 uncharacterized protein LOC125661521 [Ostrea edulis]
MEMSREILVLCWLFVAASCADQCVIKGQVNTRLQWYGYMLQKTFQKADARFEYQITYPERECCANLLIYYDDQISQLTESMTCQERVDILPKNNYQVIPLSTLNATKGCIIYPDSGGTNLYVCNGDRIFKSNGPRTWYFAISRCGASPSQGMLNMNYYFNVTGYYGKCEADPLSKTIFPEFVESEPDVTVVIILGVLCGLSTITAIVFGVLFFFGRIRRKNKKKKGGSVTSSQATMTQDIFYVNPSLSDREHSDSQYSHSQSSGSENYYEVIPDRRSYESINTQLVMHGHNVRGVSMNPNHLREHRTPNIPPYILENYPPPPYQPPSGQQNGGLHHRSHVTGHHGGQVTSQQIQNGNIPNVRPMQMHSSGHPPPSTSGHPPPSTTIIHQQHHSMSGLQTGENSEPNTASHPVHIGGNRSGSAPVHFDNVGAIARPTPIYPSSHGILFGTHPSRSSQPTSPSSHGAPNGNIPNGHINNNTIGHSSQAFKRQLSAGPKLNSVPNGQPLQLQTYQGHDKPMDDTQTPNGRTKLPNGNLPNGRTHVPNGNVAKLLHDAYRIQQFETTA